jgi:hypothetical protein
MEHINYWKDKHRHPISNGCIVVSVAPKSEYVKLYKEAIKILVKGKESPLSIEDCDIIRSHLPSSHCAVNKKQYAGFEYDHLFVKYFLNNKKYKYDPVYVAYGTDMFLYSHLYKCIKRKPKPPEHSLTSLSTTSNSSSFETDYQTTEDLLRNNINEVSFTKGELSISKRIEKLCEDIKAVLFINITSLTIEQYDKVCKNMKVLQYVYNIYKISAFFDKIKDDMSVITTEDKEIKHIYETIKDKDVPIFLYIYRKIELLYRYSFPYYYIYNNSNNCNKNVCSISHEDFTDDYALDKGDVSILPYFKGTKLKDNINEYSCFLTEDLYQWIESERNGKIEIHSIEVRNPKTNKPLTPRDIIYVYENKVRLIKRATNKIEGDELTQLIKLIKLFKKSEKKMLLKNKHPLMKLKGFLKDYLHFHEATTMNII